jgi:hypothetical protein
LGKIPLAELLRNTVKSFILMFPTLLSLSYDDGTPLASQATRSWLSAGEDGGSVSLKGAPEGLREDLEDLDPRALLSGDPNNSLALLGKPENRPASGRAALARKALEARLYLKLGRTDAAEALATHLLSETQRLGLESFDPQIATHALSAALEVFQALGELGNEGARQAFHRLVLLGPGRVPGLGVPVQ